MSERMTAAEAIVRYLIHEGVPYVLGIFGHGNIQLGEALHKYRDQITFIPVQNEQGAVHMAAAYAKHTGRPLAVTTSIGPGATNLVTGAAAAHVNRLPVLLLPGDAFSDNVAPVLQYIEGNSDVEARANDTLKPVSRYWMRINRPEQLQRALPEAFDRMMLPGSRGPAVLSLPIDVQAEAYDFDTDMLFQARDEDYERTAPDERAVERAAQLIASSCRPLIIAGGGVMMSEAWHELECLAEYAGIPVAHTQAGNGALLFEHSLNVFSIGPNGADCGNILAEKADLIIGVGTRYSDFTTSSETLFRRDARFINININPVDVGKQRAIKLVGDAKVSLDRLYAALHGYVAPDCISSYQKEIKDLRNKWIEYTNQLRDEDFTPISQEAAIAVVNDFAKERDVAICAAGSLPGDMLRLWRCKDPTRRGYHMEYGYSTMGYEIAAAIGVKLADSERNVYVMLGDGSFLMAHQELATAVREGIAFTVLLFDSKSHASIKDCQIGNGMHAFGTSYRMRNPASGELDGGMQDINFLNLARGLGAVGVSVFSHIAFIEALHMARAERSRPTVIHIPINTKRSVDRHPTWWNVPVPETTENVEALETYRENRAKRVIR